MSRKIRVYVAGPYTKPDPCANTHAAIQVGSELLDLGYAPFLPHLSHLWHTVKPRPYQDWLALDFEWLPACDVVFRMPGDSSGADQEVALAKKLGIPVVHSVDELKALEKAAIRSCFVVCRRSKL